jgi:hypothetical protein
MAADLKRKGIKSCRGILRQLTATSTNHYYRFTTIEDAHKNRLFSESRHELLPERLIFISMKFGI